MDSDNIGRRTPQHFLGVLTHLGDAACDPVQGHDGGLSGNHALSLLKEQRGGGSQINGDVSFEYNHTDSPLFILFFLRG